MKVYRRIETVISTRKDTVLTPSSPYGRRRSSTRRRARPEAYHTIIMVSINNINIKWWLWRRYQSNEQPPLWGKCGARRSSSIGASKRWQRCAGAHSRRICMCFPGGHCGGTAQRSAHTPNFLHRTHQSWPKMIWMRREYSKKRNRRRIREIQSKIARHLLSEQWSNHWQARILTYCISNSSTNQVTQSLINFSVVPMPKRLKLHLQLPFTLLAAIINRESNQKTYFYLKKWKKKKWRGDNNRRCDSRRSSSCQTALWLTSCKPCLNLHTILGGKRWVTRMKNVCSITALQYS